MKCRSLIVLLLMWLAVMPCWAQLGVGQWRDHLSYSTVYAVHPTPERIYAVGKMGLFYYDLDDLTVNKWGKGAPLTDVGISAFAYDSLSGYAVVAYSNANVDLVYQDRVYNLSDIKRSDVPGDKSIHSVAFRNRRAYLACGFGIVVVDLERKEVAETYFLGHGGTYAPVYDVAFVDSLIVAATDNGLLYADASQRFLNVVDYWQHDSLWLAGQKVVSIAYGHGSLVALCTSDEALPMLYRQLPSGAFVGWASGNIAKVRPYSEGWLTVQDGEVYLYDSNFQLQKVVADVDWLEMDANDATITPDGTLWIAHRWASLVSVADRGNGVAYNFSPTNPRSSDNVYRLVAAQHRLLLCPGGKRTTFDNVYIDGNLFTFQKGYWQGLDKEGADYFYDIVDVAVDPTDTTHLLAASWGGGIVEIYDNKVKTLYVDTNTGGALADYGVGDFHSIRTGAVAFDAEGNAWITNSLQANGLVRYGHDGTWKTFNIAAMVGGELDKIIYDSINGYKWFSGRDNRIYVHDGESQMAYVNPNNGSKVETHSVTCMVQDHSGDIWIGTDKGLKVIRNGYLAFQKGGRGEQSDVTCSNILFTQNGITEYLMAYESITCIAVDGANRKWVGTSGGGLYLISALGTEQIEHFTASNSPLFSDKVVTLAISPESGELFIGSDKGLQSYRGTATYATYYPKSEIRVFPNPVRPDYDGPIAIKGFSRNALVHVTDAAGHVVYATTANGGQAIWNGRTADGAKVASGTYFVFATDVDGNMKAVGKVLVIR